ncbi:MAG: hypothetical protein CSA84_02850 [Actinomycetales bacterium]|nr:MAG: hypothetical protein CSA84_02850 [Actinomycetales bacterium]
MRPSAGAMVAFGVVAGVAISGAHSGPASASMTSPDPEAGSLWQSGLSWRADSARSSRAGTRAPVQAVLAEADATTETAESSVPALDSPVADPRKPTGDVSVPAGDQVQETSVTESPMLAEFSAPAVVSFTLKPKRKPKPAATSDGRGRDSGSTSSGGGESGSAPPSDSGMNTSAYSGAARKLGLRGNAIKAYSAVRSRFGITRIGGYRPGPGDHGVGKAIDVMISNRAQGDAVAAYAIANRHALGVKYVIWRQRIWLPHRGNWRGMEDRGSVSANHYDHVHISVY